MAIQFTLIPARSSASGFNRSHAEQLGQAQTGIYQKSMPDLTRARGETTCHVGKFQDSTCQLLSRSQEAV